MLRSQGRLTPIPPGYDTVGGRGGGEGWRIILTRVGCVYKTHIDADRHIEAQVGERTGNVIDKGDWMTEFVSS